MKIKFSLFRFSISTLLVLILLLAVGFTVKIRFDKAKRIKAAEEWISQCLDEYSAFRGWNTGSRKDTSPTLDFGNLKRADQIIGLRDVAIDSEQQRHQIYAIRLLAKRYPEDCVPALRVIATRRIATEVRRIATICLAVTRSESNRSFFSRLIEDQDVAPQLREAAIDGLGLLQTPNRSLETYRVQSDPVVDLIDLAHPSLQPDRSGQYVWRDGKGVMGTKPPSYQPLPTWHEKPNDLRLFLGLIHESPTEPQRESAVRAIAGVAPKGYQLRVAEWGVWINSKGSLELKKRIIDEIPGFVHRSVIDPQILSSFEVNVPATKPIIHLTANMPLAVDLEVGINLGQPYFVYPKPDRLLPRGFFIKPLQDPTNRYQGYAPLEFDDLGIKSETVLRYRKPISFSWLPSFDHGWERTRFLMSLLGEDIELHKRIYGPNAHYPTADGWPSTVMRVETRFRSSGPATCGLEYKGLIVTPSKPTWAKLPEVSGTKFQWWESLRKVPSSWVTSQGETERFLYYDGPTKLPAPFSISLNEDGLQVSRSNAGEDFQHLLDQQKKILATLESDSQSEADLEKMTQAQQPLLDIKDPRQIFADRAAGEIRDALLIDRDDELAVYLVPKLKSDSRYKLSALKQITSAEAEDWLMSVTQQSGLTKEEAQGLVDSWRHEFFERGGTRLVSLMSPAQYDNYCPLKVLPKPTSLARVGLILTPIECVETVEDEL